MTSYATTGRTDIRAALELLGWDGILPVPAWAGQDLGSEVSVQTWILERAHATEQATGDLAAHIRPLRILYLQLWKGPLPRRLAQEPWSGLAFWRSTLAELHEHDTEERLEAREAFEASRWAQVGKAL